MVASLSHTCNQRGTSPLPRPTTRGPGLSRDLFIWIYPQLLPPVDEIPGPSVLSGHGSQAVASGIKAQRQTHRKGNTVMEYRLDVSDIQCSLMGRRGPPDFPGNFGWPPLEAGIWVSSGYLPRGRTWDGASLLAQPVKNLPPVQETGV